MRSERFPGVGRLIRSWRQRGIESHNIDRRTAALTAQVARIEEALQELASAGAEERLADLDRQLGALRQAVLRSGEQTAIMAARLQALRRTDAYQAPYAERPLVSVRIGAHQPGDALVDLALASIRAQSYEYWETIVVFDGPDAESAERVKALGDPRIRCYLRPQRGSYPLDPASQWRVAGVHPFNEAISHAHGDWIAPLDQDDEWTPDHLEALIDAARTSRAELVYGVCAVAVGTEGETYFGASPPREGDFGFQAAIYHAAIAELMLYDYNAHMAEEPADWNLARRMLEAGVKFEFVEQIVATYHVDQDARAFSWWRERLGGRGPFHPCD